MTLAHVCAAAVAAVGVDGAGLTMMSGAVAREILHATDGVAAALAEFQSTFGEGPGVDAFVDGGPVLIADLTAAEPGARWPAFTRAATACGARAVFALPLQVGAIRLGTLDLYRCRPGRLDDSALADALAFADLVVLLLVDAAAATAPDAADLAWQGPDPVPYEAVVHQATGMLVAQLGADAEVAFARLRAHAFAHGRPLGEVARDIVERRLRLAPDPPAARSGGPP